MNQASIQGVGLDSNLISQSASRGAARFCHPTNPPPTTPPAPATYPAPQRGSAQHRIKKLLEGLTSAPLISINCLFNTHNHIANGTEGEVDG